MFKIEEESFFNVFERNSSITGNAAGLAKQIKVGTVNATMPWAMIYKQAQMESAKISGEKSAELNSNMAQCVAESIIKLAKVFNKWTFSGQQMCRIL